MMSSDKLQIELSPEELKLILVALDWMEDDYPFKHEKNGKTHEAHRLRTKIEDLRERLEETRPQHHT